MLEAQEPLPLAVQCTVAASQEVVAGYKDERGIRHKGKIDKLREHPFLDAIHDDEGNIVERTKIPKVLINGNGSREKWIQLGKDRLKGEDRSYNEYFSAQNIAQIRESMYNEIGLSLRFVLDARPDLLYEERQLLRKYVYTLDNLYPKIEESNREAIK